MDLSQVTLTQMRYALAVAESRNFRAAAAQIPISQSGLSMQLQKLEQLLAVTLFDRSKQPVLLTPEGERALAQMRLVLREVERLGQIVSETSEPSGVYRLGVIPTLAPTIIPLFLGAFLATYPQVELLIEELKTDEILARLKADTLDGGLAVTPLHAPGVEEVPIGLEPLLAYLPPNDPLLRRKNVTQEELTERNLWVMPEGHCFRAQVLAVCRNTGGTPNCPVQFESGSFETLIRLVDEGLGATILPELVAHGLPASRQKEQLRPFRGSTPVREIALVQSRLALRRQVSDALLGTLRPPLRERLPAKIRDAEVIPPQ